MESYTHIGETIKYLRLQAHLSQEELSKDICSRKYLGMVENGYCSPTFEIINHLSTRLGINIYDNYALILQHNDIQTHEYIESLNEAISTRDFDTLNQINKKISVLPSFSTGIPFKYLNYSQSIYCSAFLKDYEQAIEFALIGLNHEDVPFLQKDPFNTNLSKADLVLAQTLAINLCRQNRISEGKKYFDFLFQYCETILASNRYFVNRNKRFELNFYAHLVYNQFTFFRSNSTVEYKRINSTIELLNNYHCSNCLPELLFCKARIEFDNTLMPDAQQTLYTARCLANLLYDDKRRNKLENELIGPQILSMI